jgi:hypothetical protein
MVLKNKCVCGFIHTHKAKNEGEGGKERVEMIKQCGKKAKN